MNRWLIYCYKNHGLNYFNCSPNDCCTFWFDANCRIRRNVELTIARAGTLRTADRRTDKLTNSERLSGKFETFFASQNEIFSVKNVRCTVEDFSSVQNRIFCVSPISTWFGTNLCKAELVKICQQNNFQAWSWNFLLRPNVITWQIVFVAVSEC